METKVDPSPTWKRDITIFLSSQTLSLFGSMLVQYAIMWHITLSTKSGIAMTLSIACGFLPTFLLSPFGGVFADRYDRKRLIMLSDGMIAVVSAVLAAIYGLGFDSLWLLLAAQAARSVGQAIQQPAVGAILPQLVPEPELMRINGLNQTIMSVIMFVCPIVSGALLSVASMSVIFLVDVVTAVPAVAILAFFLKSRPVVPAQIAGTAAGKAVQETAGTVVGSQAESVAAVNDSPASELAAAERGYLEDMKLGLRYIRDHRYLVSLFLYLSILFFLVTPAAFLTPLQTARTFGEDVWRLTAIEIVFSSGMMLGGAFLAAWKGFRNRVKTLLLANLIWALCTLALGFVPWFWLYLVFMGFFGVAMPLFNAPMATMIQEHVEGEYMGRVFGVMTMLSTSVMPIAMLVFGPIADRLRIEWLLLATGAAMVLLAIFTLANKRLIEAGVPKTDAQQQEGDPPYPVWT
jgi:MFS transporter, DHA3 family, macrolide efflux protein